jgi:predicted nucleotidyltransferase
VTGAITLDGEAIAVVCAAYGVRRLRLFGSATSERFDRTTSDIDFLVEFAPGVAHPFDAYFGLKEDLERLAGRSVDVVMSDAVRNPYFAASAFRDAVELYAA